MKVVCNAQWDNRYLGGVKILICVFHFIVFKSQTFLIINFVGFLVFK